MATIGGKRERKDGSMIIHSKVVINVSFSRYRIEARLSRSNL